MRTHARTKADPARHHHARPTPLTLESLEPRALLTAITWDGGGGDALWSNPLNWSLNFVPRQVDDVTISVPGVQRTIIADAGPIRVNSLTLDETLIVNSGVSLSSIGPFNINEDSDLRINGLVNWGSGAWRSGNIVRVNPGGSLNIGSISLPFTGTVEIDTELDNAGRLAWRGGWISLPTGASITNRAGKAMDFASPLWITGEGQLTNNGLLRRGGQSEYNTTIDVPFESTDRLFVLRGGVNFGDDPQDAPATLAGRLAALDPSSRFTFYAPATHDDGIEYRGPGVVIFNNGDQTFLGDTLFATALASFRGTAPAEDIQVTFNGGSIRGSFETDLALLRILADTTFDGTFTIISSIVSDTGIVTNPTLTLDGTLLASVMALAIDMTVAQGSTLDVGLQDFSTGSLSISSGYTLTNRGTTNHYNGTLTIAPQANLRNEATGALVLTGPTVGGGPLSSPVVNLGTLVRENSPNNGGTTEITGSLDNQGTVDVREGTLNVSGTVVQLPEVPTAQDTVLTGGTWRVRSGATLNLPQPIEIIGAQVTLDLIGLSGIPDLVGFLRENRGTMLFSGSRPGISGPGPTIVNKGTMQMGGDLFSLQVFETPVEQRAAGRIIVKTGTLQMHGLSGATRNFANPGLIRVEGGTLSLDLDNQAGVLGTFLNTGTLDIRQQGKVTVDGAASTSGTFLVEIGNPFRGHITTTRDATLGGTLQANFTGENYFNFFSASIFVVGSFTVTGSFATYTPLNVPAGYNALLITQFGVQIRLEQ